MADRIVNTMWWLAVMSMICVAAGAGLFVGYRGLFDLLAKQWSTGAAAILISIGSSAAALMLCKHRNDLL